MTELSADTAKISEVAGQLSKLADRLNGVLNTGDASLTPPPAGSDEVSVRAATTMGQVHHAFRTAGDGGVAELREISDAVATVSSSLADTDTDQGFVTT
ncbi:PE family protein [Gordonia sp. DT30]|uniref:PE family protein n=1 Tax=unclassified Gordonia (in: high G+C Gram-positive bacteria) TaxID=2657482 RepID=UPI003CF74D17